jgi:hypothetical protein
MGLRRFAAVVEAPETRLKPQGETDPKSFDRSHSPRDSHAMRDIGTATRSRCLCALCAFAVQIAVTNHSDTLAAMFSNDRQSHRLTFIAAWAKAQAGKPLEPVEAQIVQILRQHPEYQGLIADGEAALDRDFLPEQGESNPFLHMGLHIVILDQLSIDQPVGIREIYRQLLEKTGDRHEAEHRIMDCLAQALWTLQRNQTTFDEKQYLDCIARVAAGNRANH